MEGNNKITGARFIAETLKGYGVTHVFYVDAILRKTMVDLEDLGIGRILTHSEKAAAYMADGYARVSLKPGVCLAQSVGAANLAAGLQDAYLGRSAVVALTGKKPPLAQYRNAYQEIEHAPLFAPVTKYSADVVAVEQLPYLLRQAFREATSGTPRPVHLDLMGHSARNIEAAEAALPVVVEDAHTRFPAYRPQPADADIERAARAIMGAKRPVIVAGGGVRLSSAAAEVVALAEKLTIPVATSVNGKGTVAQDHPLGVGVVGSYSVRCANQVVSEADLVIYVGSNTGDQVTHGWQIPRPGTRIVQIDINPVEIGRSYPGAIGIAADARQALARLVDAVDGAAIDPSWIRRAQDIVKVWREEVEPLRRSDAIPIRPERLCKDLSELLPQNAVLVADTGYSAIWTATMVHLNQPGQTYVRAAGSLGWSFPAALGAKCAAPERPVVCFCGDGGFWYHLAEMETARRYGINTLTIVNNNGGLAQGIEDIQGVYRDRGGNPEELYRFQPVSFAQLAEDMGCMGIRVEHPEDIADAIRRGLAADRPAVVEVMTGLQYRGPKPWAPPD
ncbi:MAG TPA: thiamine pyrophosphate-binding protein [Candidatus Binatia bacterium]|jgi:acetolactate synthase-1/2/3 large subunit|nr:thiamine pyrophosphate-binding protein [Candidatus Binatia bacterium]